MRSNGRRCTLALQKQMTSKELSVMWNKNMDTHNCKYDLWKLNVLHDEKWTILNSDIGKKIEEDG